MSTALDEHLKIDFRRNRAMQITAHLMNILDRFIADDSRLGAERELFKALYEADAEILSRTQIKELERYREEILKMSVLSTNIRGSAE